MVGVLGSIESFRVLGKLCRFGGFRVYLGGFRALRNSPLSTLIGF